MDSSLSHRFLSQQQLFVRRDNLVPSSYLTSRPLVFGCLLGASFSLATLSLDSHLASHIVHGAAGTISISSPPLVMLGS